MNKSSLRDIKKSDGFAEYHRSCSLQPQPPRARASHRVSFSGEVPAVRFYLCRSWIRRIRHGCSHRARFLGWPEGFPKESSPLCWGQWVHSRRLPGWSEEIKWDHAIALVRTSRMQGQKWVKNAQDSALCTRVTDGRKACRWQQWGDGGWRGFWRLLHFRLLSLLATVMGDVRSLGTLWFSFHLVFRILRRKWKCFINLFCICLIRKKTQKANQIQSATTTKLWSLRSWLLVAH